MTKSSQVILDKNYTAEELVDVEVVVEDVVVAADTVMLKYGSYVVPLLSEK